MRVFFTIIVVALALAPGPGESTQATAVHSATGGLQERSPGVGVVPGPTADDAQPPQPSQHPAVAAALSRVLGGPHDFSARSGRPSDACSACHVPHVQAVRPALPDGDDPPGDASDRKHPTDAPTHAHEPDPALDAARQAVLELYRLHGQRSTFEPDCYTPGPTSLICLGCHDGTVAASTIGTAHAMLSSQRAGFDVPDGFVWRDHPIGVPYPSDPRRYRPRMAVERSGVRLPDGRLECVSCHDPHGTAGLDHLLIVSNRRSALCLTCHLK